MTNMETTMTVLESMSRIPPMTNPLIARKASTLSAKPSLMMSTTNLSLINLMSSKTKFIKAITACITVKKTKMENQFSNKSDLQAQIKMNAIMIIRMSKNQKKKREKIMQKREIMEKREKIMENKVNKLLTLPKKYVIILMHHWRTNLS